MPGKFPKTTNKILFSVFFTHLSDGRHCNLWNAWKPGLGGRMNAKWSLSWKPPQHTQFLRTIPDTASPTYKHESPGSSEQQLRHTSSAIQASAGLIEHFSYWEGEQKGCRGRDKGASAHPPPLTGEMTRGKLSLLARHSRVWNLGGLVEFYLLLGHGCIGLRFCRFFSASNTKSFFIQTQGLTALYNLLKRNTGP